MGQGYVSTEASYVDVGSQWSGFLRMLPSALGITLLCRSILGLI